MNFSNRLNNHIESSYFAPRGRARIYDVGMRIAQGYLSPFDQLIGVIGEAGSGKSALIKGMFPGLELTNDDEGVNVRPLPILHQEDESGFFTPHTYHMDVRFEQGFTQLPVLADAVQMEISRGKRVVIEHFDMIYPFLRRNADLLIGVGEEIVISRPNLFGPYPDEIKEQAYNSLKYRLMAHTSEDLCEFCMPNELINTCTHDDIHHGFILAFDDTPPDIDLVSLEEGVRAIIHKDVPIEYHDDSHILINGHLHPCTGPRTHVSHTGEITGFSLLKRFIYDKVNDRYLMVACVGENSEANVEHLDKINRWQSGEDVPGL